MKQLALHHPVPLREAIARECARIITQAEHAAEALRREGKHKRADELLENRKGLVAVITRASSYAQPARRRRRP